jgi:hypothetical protein
MDPSRLPNLIMVGPGKAGTTSLFWYLSQHPSICPSDVKEIRYFAPITHGGDAIGPVWEYADHFSQCGGQPYRLEASPQYFHGGKALITAMRSTLGEPHVIVTLRDPIQRMWSIYRSLKVRRTLPSSMDFDAYIAACEAVRASGQALTRGNRAYWTLSGSFYVDHITPWLDSFGDRVRVTFFERMADDAPGEVASICRWLRIDEAQAASFRYTLENETVGNRSRLLHRLALAANREGLLRDRRKLKAPLRKAYYAINRKPQTDRMSEAARRRLAETFGPFNAALAVELRRRGYADLPPWLAGAADTPATDASTAPPIANSAAGDEVRGA